MKVWICAIAKMEELYIREWIEWHKDIGVDHIIIGDNNNSDYDKPLCPIIQDYIDDGFVEVINKNDELEIQLDFYNDIYNKRKKEFDWIGFIDIDEFVELPAYNNDIHKFLNDKKFENANAIILPWLLYGSEGQLYYENKPVRERFKNFRKHVQNDSHVSVKFFVRPLNFVSYWHSLHSPLNYKDIKGIMSNGKNNDKIKCCDSVGNFNWKPANIVITQNGLVWFTDIQMDETEYYDSKYYSTAYISHYLTKSTEEYIKYKSLRGRQQQECGFRYHRNLYYWLNDKTEETERMFDLYENEINNARKNIIKKYNFDNLSLCI